MLDNEIQIDRDTPWEDILPSLEQEEYVRQETHYCHTLVDFQEVVRQYGIERVMHDLDEATYWILEKWFIKGEVTK